MAGPFQGSAPPLAAGRNHPEINEAPGVYLKG
jgi:hypothetical protein